MLTETQIFQYLENVTDPEIPNVSIWDMGILRDVKVIDDDTVNVIITPTYSGCPAMDVISMQVRMTLIGYGIKNVNVELKLSPAWTTDWITEKGHQRMLEYGIAPPVRKAANVLGLFEEDEVPCPKCQSKNTTLISRFGATSCKSMYSCLDCKEPFEHFKCH